MSDQNHLIVQMQNIRQEFCIENKYGVINDVLKQG